MSMKKLLQTDLRKVMQDHKKKIGNTKRIDSPLAKYNDSGQLTCVICKSIIKNETVWVVHLNSKSHKENVALAKKLLTQKESSVPKKQDNPLKRPSSTVTNEESSKKIKGILKNSGNSGRNLPQTSALPSDFFDKPVSTNKSAKIIDKPAEREVNTNGADANEKVNGVNSNEKANGADPAAATPLPEGFFDDPILDAKVRNVEYKDPVEEEWDKFLKEIKEETAQSAQIIAEDHEEATAERQIDEIDEQINHWTRVMNLVKCKEQLRLTQKEAETVASEDDSSDNENNFDEFFDWRAKNYEKKV